MPDNNKKYDWINCPNCSRHYFKTYESNFDIEIKCPSCGGTYRVWYEDNKLCVKLTGNPKRYGPVEFK